MLKVVRSAVFNVDQEKPSIYKESIAEVEVQTSLVVEPSLVIKARAKSPTFQIEANQKKTPIIDLALEVDVNSKNLRPTHSREIKTVK